MNITKKIFIALFLGACLGIILNILMEIFPAFDLSYLLSIFVVVGKLFISSLKMLVVPVVFVSLVCGISGLGEITNLGRIGIKTICLYMLTTCMAITLALIMAYIVQPGISADFDLPSQFELREAPPISNVLINLIPSNPFKSFSDGNMLQIIFFALILGSAISIVGEKAKNVILVFNSLNTIVLKMGDADCTLWSFLFSC